MCEQKSGEEATAAKPIPIDLAENEDQAKDRFHRYKAIDPYPDIAPSLLNSADILAYIKATSLVFPFDEECLTGASYDVKILGEVVYWDEAGKKQNKVLGSKDEGFDLCPNSIAFVTVEPVFRIPHYLALRFNLKIKHIYKGLLLGTGPLVDPGFEGKLSIPLHNLTSNTYHFRGYDKLITMEFTKMSANKLWNDKAPDVRDSYKPNNIESYRGVNVYIANALKNDGLNTVVSSIPAAMLEGKESAKQSEKAARSSKRSANIQAAISILAVCALVMTCIGFSFSALNRANDRYDELIKEYASRVASYERKIDELEQRIDALAELAEEDEESVATDGGTD